jgi:integrase
MRRVNGIYDDDGQLMLLASLTQHKPMMGVLYYLGIVSGLRIGDLLSIKADEVGQTFTVIETKTGKEKAIVLCDDGWALVRLYAEDAPKHGRLFPVSRQTVHKYFKRACKDLGLVDIAPHSMRKIYGWNVWRLTSDIHIVRKALNHTYTSTTIAYLVDGFKWLTDFVYSGRFGGIKPSYKNGDGENGQ